MAACSIVLSDWPRSFSVEAVLLVPEFCFNFVNVPSSTLFMNFVLIGISGYSCKTSSVENKSSFPATCFLP